MKHKFHFCFRPVQFFKTSMLLGILFIVFVWGCEETLELPKTEQQVPIVVEAYIEENQYPLVFLSSGSSFWHDIDSVTLYEMIVGRAKVSIYSESDSEILTLRRDHSFYPPFYYEGTRLKGKQEEPYRILVEYQDQQVTGNTTIPPPVQIDSLWIQYENNNPNQGIVYIQLSDPAEQANYYRTYTKRKNIDSRFIPTQINTFQDKYFEGQTIEFGLHRGMGDLSELAGDNHYFVRGDTITVKFCTIDQVSFHFWNLLQGRALGTNSFAPSGENLPSNVENGLGIICGMNCQEINIIAQ